MLTQDSAAPTKVITASEYETRGHALFTANHFADAEQCFRHALSLEPTRLSSLLGLANCLLLFGRFEDARTFLETARSLHPHDPQITAKLASTYLQQGDIEDALAAFQVAEEQAGSEGRPFGMQFVQALAYLPDVTAADLNTAGREWEERYAKPVARPPLRPINGRIRIGYYSPDLRNHSISYYLRPILREYDRSQFEVYLYSDSRLPDHVTEELRSYADHWHELCHQDDNEAIAQIKNDELHLLIDLTGYFGETRPWIFAARPAPVQAHLLGYNGTTGLTSLDYRYSDAITDPPEDDPFSSEKVIRLEPGFHCFLQEPNLSVSEGQAPCKTESGIHFGCYSNVPKLNDEVLDAWVSILNSVPNSRLLLKVTGEEDIGGQDRMIARFTSRGLAPERIELIPRTGNKRKHLESHRRVDIILDSFPVNGTTTTFEALWMGVPVLALLGDRHSARVCASILSQIGLTDGITHTVEEYIQRAITWSQDRAQIQAWRKSLRCQLNNSPIGDAKKYVRQLEQTYLQITSPNHLSKRLKLTSI